MKKAIKKNKAIVVLVCTLSIISLTHVKAQDNLGNHTATQNLNMNYKEIDNIQNLDIRSGASYGVRFWGGLDNYSIKMGNTSQFAYGPIPVGSYSIKFNMSNNTDRGWTWGVNGSAPTAALTTDGRMQLAKDLYAMGKIGIGITSPQYKLQIYNNGTGAIRADAMNGHIRLFETDGTNMSSYTQIERNMDAFHIYQNNGSTFQHVLTADMNGNIGIGTTDPQNYKLAVKGHMIAEEISVKLHANWPDYVFTKEYGLMNLEDVQTYINENSHLPNVPSAKEVEEEGINVGEMNAILLQKIEELTLYVLELKNENKMIKAEIETIKSK